jgi:hypothetical protein
MDASEWGSVIASMSYYGEEDGGFYRAMNFHRADPVPPSVALTYRQPLHIDELPSDKPVFRITVEQVEAAIEKEIDFKLGEKTTVVLLKLKNGFEITGVSGCVDPALYDHELGKKYARERAISRVWELLAFELQTQMAQAVK